MFRLTLCLVVSTLVSQAAGQQGGGTTGTGSATSGGTAGASGTSGTSASATSGTSGAGGTGTASNTNIPAKNPGTQPKNGGLFNMGLLGLASGSDFLRDMTMLGMLTNNKRQQAPGQRQNSGLDMAGVATASVLTGADNIFRNMIMAKALSGQRGGGGGFGGGLGGGLLGTLALTGGLGDSFRRFAGLSMMTRPGGMSNPLGLMFAGNALDLGFGLGGDNMFGALALMNMSPQNSQQQQTQQQQQQQQQQAQQQAGGFGSKRGQSIMPWLFMDGWKR